MKKLLIFILVLIVIGIGFYYGYRKSSHSQKTVTLHTSGTNHPIHLEYKKDNDSNTGESVNNSNGRVTIKGTMTRGNLVNNLCLNDKSLGLNNYYLNVNPELEKQKYQINLSYAKQDPAINIVNDLGKEMGFSTKVSETTLTFYMAIRNDKPIQFTIAESHNATIQGNLHSCRFSGADYKNILMQYKSNGLYIEDSTGITDRFDGEITLDKDNPELMKSELQNKAGIDLIPFDKTIKLISIN